MKRLPSPLPWFGGKSANATTGLNSWLIDLLPAVSPGQTYVEPYAGMLGVLLARQQAYNEVANDLDGRVVNFWRVLRDEPEELKRRLEYTPHCRQTFAEACQILEAPDDHSDVVQAWSFVVATAQSLMSRVGHAWSTRRGFTADGLPLNVNMFTVQRFNATSDRLVARIKNLTVEHKQGAEVASYYASNPHAVIYCDPPYSQGSYGYRAKANLEQLCDAVRDAEARVLISGYRDDPYDDLLDWQRHEREAIVSIVNAEDVQRIECAWTNYEIESARQILLAI